jgi:hypothetical protein
MQSRSSKERDAKTPRFKRDVWFPMETASTTHTNLPKQPARADRSNTRALLRWSAVVSGYGNPNAPSLTHEDSREEHMKKVLVFATLALIAAACSNAPQTVNTSVIDSTARGSRTPTPSVDSSKYEVAGMLEVTVSGIKPNSSEGTTTAKFFAADKPGKLSSKGLLVPNSNITFTPQYVSSFDTFSGPTTTRYVEAGFAITNNSANLYYNMTMVAASLAAATTSSGLTTTVGGTALSDILNGGGVPITDVAVARSMNPVHGFTPSATYAPSITKADLHYLTPAEAASVKAQGQSTGQIPAININKVFPLEYGFVARNAQGTGRTIGASTCTPVNCNKGSVTFAYSFPLDPSLAKQPYSYKMQFVVANEFIATWSQMLDYDPGAGTVAGIPYANPTISTHRTRVLEYRGAAKTFIPASGVDTLDNVCSIKTANAVGVDPALQYPVVNPTFTGAWDGCFGEGGVRARTYSTNFGKNSSLTVDPVSDEVVTAGVTGALSFGDTKGTKIAVSKFNKAGQKTLSFEFTPTAIEVGQGAVTELRVTKVLVDKFYRDIYVFGFAGSTSFEFGCFCSAFVISFDGFTGQKLAHINFPLSGSTILAQDPTGDMYFDQQFNSTPVKVYVVFSETQQVSPNADQWVFKSFLGGSTAGIFPTNTAFGTAGTYTTTWGTSNSTIFPAVLTGNANRLVAVGSNNADSAVLTVATSLTGVPDATWDFDGIAAYTNASLGIQPLPRFAVTSGKLLSDGKLLIAGHTRFNSTPTIDTEVFLTKTNTSGAIDTLFGTTQYNCDPNVYGEDLNPRIALRSNGEIYLVSQTGAVGSTGHCMSRRTATGTIISRQNYDMYFGQVKIPANDAQFTASGRLAIGGRTGTSAMVGLIKQ